jgi:hypothetical protein
MAKGGIFPPVVAIIGGEERGGLGGPLGSATDASVERDQRTSSAHRVPLLRVAVVWARG